MKAVHIIGVPLDLGGNRRGTDMGPSAFRIAGISEQIATLGLSVTDKGDIPSPIPEAKGPGDAKKRYPATDEGHARDELGCHPQRRGINQESCEK